MSRCIIPSVDPSIPGLHQFISHGGGDSPPISVFLCLGEKWPDPDARPWEKKLVTVEVRGLPELNTNTLLILYIDIYCLNLQAEERGVGAFVNPAGVPLPVSQVVFTSLEMLKELAIQGGASSLQSVELQLSLQ